MGKMREVRSDDIMSLLNAKYKRNISISISSMSCHLTWNYFHF